MSQQEQDLESRLEQRLELARKPENTGEDLRAVDYILLVVVTIALPTVLMIAGSYL